MKLPKRALSSALFAAALVACGPNTQENSSTALARNNDVQAGVIVPQERVGTGISPAEVAAAKARQPHQYDEARPLSLFDFRTNLNPNSNR